jgi:hypothetical protein
MRSTWFAAAVLAAGSLAFVPAARADDPPPRRAPPPSPDGSKPGDAAKPDAQKPDAPKPDPANLRVEKAKQLVKELEDAVARAKAAQPVDAQMLQILMVALDQAKALAKAAKPDELTNEEKQAVLDEAKKAPAADPAAPKDPAAGWGEKAVEKALADADLTEEESIKAKKIIGDWWTDNMASMGDSKKQSDLKRKRDDDLEKALGKKARKVINNLNAMGPRR